jgi:hypothetical protein
MWLNRKIAESKYLGAHNNLLVETLNYILEELTVAWTKKNLTFIKIQERTFYA